MSNHINPPASEFQKTTCSECFTPAGMHTPDRAAFIKLLQLSGWRVGMKPLCPKCNSKNRRPATAKPQ